MVTLENLKRQLFKARYAKILVDVNAGIKEIKGARENFVVIADE